MHRDLLLVRLRPKSQHGAALSPAAERTSWRPLLSGGMGCDGRRLGRLEANVADRCQYVGIRRESTNFRQGNSVVLQQRAQPHACAADQLNSPIRLKLNSCVWPLCRSCLRAGASRKVVAVALLQLALMLEAGFDPATTAVRQLHWSASTENGRRKTADHASPRRVCLIDVACFLRRRAAAIPASPVPSSVSVTGSGVTVPPGYPVP